MSEYQCYEFVALDQSLTARQMAELRAISTRAEISPTRFWNTHLTLAAIFVRTVEQNMRARGERQ